MKSLFIGLACITSFGINAQIVTPKLSPTAKIHQTVGLTDIVIEYSRPGKRGRTVFPDVVPMDEVWRTGANKNSTITVSNNLIFGTDTLKVGTYAIFTKPSASAWDIIFYAKHDNWGTPDTWSDEDVALSVKANTTKLSEEVESFTISIDNVSTKDAILSFTWDKTKAAVKFSVATNEQVLAAINKTMSGPTSGDYYSAADYYLNEKTEYKKALEYINKAIELRDDQPFWMLRKKSLIQAELGDYKGAIESAKLSLEGAKKAEYQNYINMNEESIEAWSKKK